MLKKTLQNKLVFLVLSIILFFGLTSCVVVFFIGQKILIENKKEDLFVLVKESAQEIKQIFVFNQKVAEKISQNKVIKDYLVSSPQNIQDPKVLNILNEYLFSDNYLAIYLMNDSGKVLISTDKRFLEQNYNFRNYFKKAVDGENFFEINLGATSAELGYYFSSPIFDNQNKIKGVLVVKLVPEIVERTLTMNKNLLGDVMLVNSEGVIIYSNLPERKFKSLGKISEEGKKKIQEFRKFPNIEIAPLGYNLIQEKIEKQEKDFVVDLFDVLDNEKEFLAGTMIGDTPFFLVLEVYYNQLIQQTLSILLILVVCILLTIILSSIVIVFIISSSFQPLKKLKEVAYAISLGDFNKKVSIKTGDELEELGVTINSMIDSLRESYTNLENKVNLKTKEINTQLINLSEKNHILADTQKAIMNVLEDIEEEKNHSESLAKDLLKFQLAVENASDHIIITDMNGKILFANKAAEKITGFKFKEMKDQTPMLWGKQMPLEFYKKFWKTIKEEKKTFSGEILNKRKNGEIYVAEVYVAPILKNQEVQFFVGIERDITKAKEVDKAKTEFVSLASHQLRTPLTAISWYLEMLMKGKAGKLKPEQLKYLEEVYKGGIRMRDLVNALLNVSRIDLGTFSIEPEKTDIKKICDSVIAEMKPTILNKKIKIVKKYINVPVGFVADKNLFRIILQNLISNAVKYTSPKGKINIKIEGKEKEVLFTVEDNGCGIPLNQQKKIFNKLYRADNAKIKDPDGTGLGLYIVKSILDSSGGKIWFISEENKGSTFFVSLPLSGMSKKEGVKNLI